MCPRTSLMSIFRTSCFAIAPSSGARKRYSEGNVNSPRPTGTDVWRVSWRRSPTGRTTEGMGTPGEGVRDRSKSSAGALSRPHLRHAVEAFRAADRPLGTGRRPQGDPLRDLFRQLQQSAHWRGDSRGPLPQRGRNRSAGSPVLRHAATRAGQPRCGRQIGFRGCSDSRPPDMMSSR
jgi:hypothetical protein